MFNLAVFPFPCSAGLSARLAALNSGASPLGAIGVGFLIAVLTLVAGQIVFTLVSSGAVRAAVALLFAAPAAVDGYHLARRLSWPVSGTTAWQQAFAIIGAVVVGATAAGRLMLPLTSPRGAPATLVAE